jgi:hypothetical protein
MAGHTKRFEFDHEGVTVQVEHIRTDSKRGQMHFTLLSEDKRVTVTHGLETGQQLKAAIQDAEANRLGRRRKITVELDPRSLIYKLLGFS